MVKFLLSFLISFKSFPDNDTFVFSDNTDSKQSEGESRPKNVRLRTHPERKNVCNITYCLPGPKETIERKISVACWSRVLKIYGKKDDYFFRTEWCNEKTWAAFSVRQRMDDINLEQLKAIFSKSLDFYFNEDQRNMPRFKNEPFGAYLCPNVSKDNRFAPVINLKEKSRAVVRGAKSTLTLQSNRNGKKKRRISKNGTESIRHRTVFVNGIEPEICKTIAPGHIHKIIKVMEKSNSECSATRSPSNNYLFLPVSNLFYDKPVWVLKSEKVSSRNVQDFIVFITVYSFLDEETRERLNPFCINVDSLHHLPAKELHEEGIYKVFVEYELEPIIPKTRTKILHLKRNCVSRLKDIKVFLTEEITPLTIISSLQSRKLFVKVIGIRDSLPDVESGPECKIYGSIMTDDRLSSCIKTPVTVQFQRPRAPVRQKSSVTIKPTQTRRRSSMRNAKNKAKKLRDDILYHNKDYLFLIGMSRIDLSPLVFGNSSVMAYEELSSLPVMIDDQPYVDIEHLAITEIHKDLSKYEKGQIKNRLLYENTSVIKLTAKCGYLLTPQCVMSNPSINTAFSRVIIILFDKDFATNILKKIFMYNRETLDMRDYNFPLIPFRKMYKVESTPRFRSILNILSGITECQDETYPFDHTGIICPDAYFTGFCIDSIHRVLMYVEGPAINTFPKLLTELIKFNTIQGRILYSSDLIYETRIYEAFKHYGGVYCITLKSAVDDFLKKGTSWCHKVSAPEPAWIALKLIHKLLATKSVLEAVQNNYLPRPEQLISFDIEFGLPHCILR